MATLFKDDNLAGAIGLGFKALAAGLAFLVSRFVYRGVKIRMHLRQLARQGIPILPHSWLFGHLPLVVQHRKDFPGDLHVSLFFLEITKNYKKYFPDRTAPPSVTYLDLWPLGNAVCVCVDPVVSPQFTQTKSLPKGTMVKYLMGPLTGGRDLVSLEGDEWKLWRSRFNPGFSARNITALVPTILEEVDVFVHQLEQLAGPDGSWGDVFQLEKRAMNLTFDVIGRAALDVKFGEQTRPESSPFKVAFFRQLSWMVMGASISTIVARKLPSFGRDVARNAKIMDDYLIPYVQDRNAIVEKQQQSLEKGSSDTSPPSEKFIIDLALKALQKDGDSSQLLSQPSGDLMQTLLAQLKVFIFAGHDTTASTIAWGFHLLSKNPEALARLRAEHDSVFGATATDVQSTRAQIAASPRLLNQLPYTVAVIKETLRLQPPAASWRQGQPGFFLTTPGSDIQYPTDGFLVLDSARALQNNPSAWERAGDFVPERFLQAHPDASAASHGVEIREPPAHGWRPFEQGPRNCIGQELAMTELKMVFALVARQFDIECAWDKWDALKGRQGAGGSAAGVAQKTTYNGDRLYAFGESTAHCKDSMPAHVRLREIV
ncbi:sterigmatocystin biosynthesis cytochrome P450 monooxygenase [Microdochium nivale]|nr:sterigmatocystin biosynthesis cytochrome P450 monooxygenase [Microdochium nivale]